jgi:hypothetical protein
MPHLASACRGESFLHSPKMPHQMSHLLEKKHVIHSDILGYFCFYILLLDWVVLIMQIAIYVKFWFLYLCTDLHEWPWPFRVLERMPPHGVPLNQKIEEKGIGRQQQKTHQIHTHNNGVTLLNMTSHVFLARLLDWSIFLGVDSF